MQFIKTLPVIGNIFEKTTDIIAEIIPDKDLQAKIKAELSGKMALADYSLLTKEIQSQAQTLALELTGNKLQRNWRPHLMYFIMGMLFWLIVIVPVAGIFGVKIPVKEALESVPVQMWTLLTAGVSGYVVLRSGEKIMDKWAKRNNK